MAALTVVGWVADPIIQMVIEKASSCAASSILRFHRGIPEGLDRLRRALGQLRQKVRAVERQRAKGNGSDDDKWLLQVKDAVYEVDDVLDGFLYQDLQPSRALSSLVKFAKRLAGADEALNRLEEVLKKIDDVVSSSDGLVHVTMLEASGPSDESNHSAGRCTGSVRGHEQVFGRDTELKEMVSWLLGTADGSAQPVPVAAIVGLGGMGKTTLAQLVFREVESRFDLTVWVQHVGTDTEVELATRILESAKVDMPAGTTSFDSLQRKLKDAFTGRKFLLVLDDVWYRENWDAHRNRKVWDNVLAPLKYGKAGSRIVVTTRTEIVVDVLNAKKRIPLDGLAFDDIWSLFKYCAFGEGGIDKFPVLQEIGKQIAAKLNGLPLAAEVIGRMLAGTRSASQWRKVSKTEIFGIVGSTLEPSYRNLPEHLQRCFALCSIFPKNWRFKPHKLVKIWMALDFVRPEGDKLLEDVGRGYFKQLVDRSFFHANNEGRRTCYLIHDLMHDLAVSVSRHDCARVEGAKTKEIPRTIRHLSVTSDAVLQIKGWCELKKLRTFLILRHPSAPLDQLPDDLLTELKAVRVLGLDGCDMVDISETIGQLIHLRYLALCKTIVRLPQSVSKLFLLETLQIPKRCHPNELPKDMKNLTRLRHLDMNRESTSKVVGIGKLVRLQGSIEFHVKKRKGHMLEDLNDLNHLRRKLHIKNLDVVEGRQEASKAGLGKKQNVKVLELEWNSAGKSIPSVHVEVLEGLEPHLNVEELCIRRYHGSISPSWLNINLKDWMSLRSLYLINCRKLEDLPPLGQLPCLRLLRIREICSLKRIGSEFYGTGPVVFPCLAELEFNDMPQLVEWTKEENIDMFRVLCKLNILDCPKLIKVPPFPPSLRKVTVDHAGFISHMKLSSSSSSKACSFALETSATSVIKDGLLHREQVEAIAALTIRHHHAIKFEELQALVSLKNLQICQSDITDEQLSSCLQGLHSLTLLEIVNCSNITSLPHVEHLSCITKFHELRIRQCPQLSSLNSLPDFTAFESLVIQNCSRLTAKSFPDSFEGLNTLKKLSILYCTGLESLPNGFPSSLQVLRLIGCKPRLLQQLQMENGSEWDKIACVPMKQIS